MNKKTDINNSLIKKNKIHEDGARHIVGIGTSAGGLDALVPLVYNLAHCGNSAFIIARHMASTHESTLAEILSGHTSLSVVTVKNGDFLQPDTIYVIPPDNDATVSNSHIHLKPSSPEFRPNPSADILFKSIAESCGEYSVAVILSGSGSDGTAGAEAVRKAGGLVLVQKCEEAADNGMPCSVIESGYADFQLYISEIADFLNSLGGKTAVSGECPDISDNDSAVFIKILEMVSSATQMDVAQYKEATLRRQIKKRITALGLKSAGDYLDYLENHPEELTVLQHSFLISVTSFFRDSEPFSALEKILADTVSKKQPGDSIRIWVPGCATGEEAYSISIILNEILENSSSPFDIKIFATDIDVEAIAIARAGIYSSSALENIDTARKKMWFSAEGKNWKIKKRVRNNCVFSIHDVICHPSFIRMDIISCRNLLIYLKPSLQSSLISNFHYALNPGGCLLLGKSESTGHTSKLFENIDITNKIFRKKASSVSRPARLAERPACVSPVSGQPAVKLLCKIPPAVEMVSEILINKYAPASILVNHNFEVLHFFGNAKRYMSLPEGSADFSLFSLCLPEISREMKILCYRAVQSKKPELSGLPAIVSIDGQPVMLRLALHRIQTGQGKNEYSLLISFEENGFNDFSGKITEMPDAADDEILKLRHELSETREHLQTVIEAFESSNEELQSLNEEQQASSEELQSSNEELQASNEELTTLNDELRLKSTELANLNSILSNIQDSIQMGLVVIDREGRIVRFNAPAVRVFGLMAGDTGRCLTGIPCYPDLPDLGKQIADVISTGTSCIEKIRHNLYHYLMQISPSINESGQCTGAVLTFTDISDMQRAEEALLESRQHSAELAAMLENSSQPFGQGLPDGKIGFFNKAFLELTGYSRKELSEMDWAGKLTPAEWLPYEMEKLKELHETGKPVRYQKEYTRRDGTSVPVELFVHMEKDDSDKLKFYYSFVTDITERLKAEEALKMSERRFRKLIEEAPDGIFIQTGGCFTYMNRTAIRLFGVASEKELIGTPVIDRFHPDHRADVLKRIQRVNLKREAVPLIEEKILRMDGVSVFTEVSAIPFVFNNESGALVFLHDITERKLAQNMIVEREKQLSAVTRNFPGLVARIDSNMRFLFANHGCEKLFGISAENMTGRKIHEIIGEKAFIHTKPYAEKALAGQKVSFESILQNQSGEPFYAQITMLPDMDEDGSVNGFFIFGTDVTERKIAEDALRKNEKLLKSIIDNADGIIWLKDPEGRFLIINRYAENTLGIDINGIQGKTVFDIFPDDVAKEYSDNDRKVISHGHAITFEESAMIDGVDRTFLAVKFPLRDADNNIYALGAICTDITDHQNLINEKNRLQEQVIQSQKLEAIGRLAGGVAHDFNNMLAAISGFAELAITGINPEDPIHKDIGEILKAARRSADLVQQLMAFARKQAVNPAELDLNITIISMLKILGRLIGENIELVWIPCNNIWKIRMDPSQIDQILANLAVNARDAISGNGKITIETGNVILDENYCSKETGINPGNYVMLAITDDGCGMSRETIAGIFEPFFTTKAPGEGTGLGLATVYGIVKQNSGLINVYSEPGKGSAFKLYFPEYITAECLYSDCSISETSHGKGETILMVEDEKAILDVGVRMLEKLGYNVLSADNPADAIRLAETNTGKIELLVSDVIMPGMNGKELAIKISGIRPGIKILYMSGYTDNVIAKRGILDEGVNFIQKPFSLHELAEMVNRSIQGSK